MIDNRILAWSKSGTGTPGHLYRLEAIAIRDAILELYDGDNLDTHSKEKP